MGTLLSAPTLISSTIARLGAAISSNAASLPGEEELLSLPHQELQGQLKELRVSEEQQETVEVAPNVLARSGAMFSSVPALLPVCDNEYSLTMQEERIKHDIEDGIRNGLLDLRQMLIFEPLSLLDTVTTMSTVIS